MLFIFDLKNSILMQLRDDKPNIAAPNMWGPIGGDCKEVKLLMSVVLERFLRKRDICHLK